MACRAFPWDERQNLAPTFTGAASNTRRLKKKEGVNRSKKLLGVPLNKHYQMSSWDRRPLLDGQAPPAPPGPLLKTLQCGL